jgi:hypothetical protein
LGEGDKVVNSDGSTGRPPRIGLAHELIHAEHNMAGVNKNQIGSNSPDPDGSAGRTLTREELNTRIRENEIRFEQKVKPRQIIFP